MTLPLILCTNSRHPMVKRAALLSCATQSSLIFFSENKNKSEEKNNISPLTNIAKPLTPQTIRPQRETYEERGSETESCISLRESPIRAPIAPKKQRILFRSTSTTAVQDILPHKIGLIILKRLPPMFPFWLSLIKAENFQ
ncbi:MAG: hypothetical protein KIH08_14765 [Candidatus Freyarchaeota archaeon]|nr:hypothetical protein [Candidatus Jordarchaeia archaeon]MBS7270625.1 hypothetical protein [Candidatus Jordarchaeia archaeon]MBS7281346.1 hypothetical protein [Candidatus Jordarchaeia archaeon]